MQNIFGLDRAELGAVMAATGARAFQARQVYSWLYRKRVTSIDAMTDLDKGRRARLARTHEIAWPKVAERQRSSDGTVKYLFALADGPTVEAVAIPESRRRTMCLSTQAGCPLKCAFCLTGISGYRRNLKSAEILGQAAVLMADPAGADRKPESPAWNIVLMGMGEPLLNATATIKALRILMDGEGFGVPPRKLTLSTVGILPGLERLMREPVRPNLAISLHAPDPRLRGELMPIEARYPLHDVVEAASRYEAPGSGRVTYEYVLLKDVNDAPHHARQLARLLSRRRCKVNLIPLNPAPEIPFEPPSAAAVEAFRSVLMGAGVAVSVRKPRGQDILAACGQLHFETPKAVAAAGAAAV